MYATQPAKITVLDTLIEALIETANDAVNSGYPYNSIPFLSHLQQVIFLGSSQLRVRTVIALVIHDSAST